MNVLSLLFRLFDSDDDTVVVYGGWFNNQEIGERYFFLASLIFSLKLNNSFLFLLFLLSSFGNYEHGRIIERK